MKAREITREQLGALLLKEIDRLGISQAEAGRRAGMQPPHVTRALHHLVVSYDHYRLKLAAALLPPGYEKIARFTKVDE